jgi:hypothetical protein
MRKAALVSPEKEFKDGWVMFTGGLNLERPTEVADNELTESENFILNKRGVLTTRPGSVKHNTGSLNAGEYFTHLSDYQRRTGSVYTSHFLGFTNQGRIWRINPDGTYNNLASGYTSNMVWRSKVWQNTLIFAVGGAHRLQKYDASTFGDLSADAPQAKDLEVFNGKLWAIDDIRLYASKDNDPTGWTPTPTTPDALSFLLLPDTGGKATTLCRFYDSLLAMKEHIIVEIVGNSVSNFQVADKSIDAGTTYTGGAMPVGNNVWMWDDTFLRSLAGVQQFGDDSQSIISNKVNPFFNGGIGFKGLERVFREQTKMHHFHDNDTVCIAFTGKGDTQNTQVIFAYTTWDRNSPAWMIQKYPFPISCFGSKHSETAGEELWAADYSGNVYRLLVPSAITDNDVLFTKKFMTGSKFFGDPRKYKRFMTIYFTFLSSVAGSVTVRAKGLESEITRQMSIIASGSRWGQMIWGEDVWSGAESTQRSVISDLNFRDTKLSLGVTSTLAGHTSFGEMIVDGTAKSYRRI